MNGVAADKGKRAIKRLNMLFHLLSRRFLMKIRENSLSLFNQKEVQLHIAFATSLSMIYIITETLLSTVAAKLHPRRLTLEEQYSTTAKMKSLVL